MADPCARRAVAAHRRRPQIYLQGCTLCLLGHTEATSLPLIVSEIAHYFFRTHRSEIFHRYEQNCPLKSVKCASWMPDGDAAYPEKNPYWVDHVMQLS